MEGSRKAISNGKKKFTSSKWHWTREEDELLTQLVNRYGPTNWEYIAGNFQGRTGKSCRLRWLNQLDPKVDKSPFTCKERKKLLELHKAFGNKWTTIMSFFPGRTDNQLKNQYNILVGRHIKASTDSSSTNNPIDLSNSGNVSTLGFGPQFAEVSCWGNYYNALAPGLSDSVEMPFSGGGSSSVYGRDVNYRSSDGVNLGNFGSNQIVNHGDSMMSDATSSADVKDYQFIDFLGVGKSE